MILRYKRGAKLLFYFFRKSNVFGLRWKQLIFIFLKLYKGLCV